MGNNSISNSIEMMEFNEFIENMELVDVVVVGNNFSWSNVDGSARSRLDSILMPKYLYLVEGW